MEGWDGWDGWDGMGWDGSPGGPRYRAPTVLINAYNQARAINKLRYLKLYCPGMVQNMIR